MTRLNLLLLLVLLASAVYLVRVSYDARRLFNELDRAQSAERKLETEYGRLQSERQSQATSLRVEKTARDKLGMRAANPAITQYVGDSRALPTAASGALSAAAAASEMEARR